MTSTDYGVLLHAYGPADDTPGHLAALAGADPGARSAALEHLWMAIIHQGTPWTATAPAAATVAGLISDPRLAGDPGLRANLLGFLAAVARAGDAYGGDLAELAQPPGVDVDSALRAAIADGDLDAIFGDEILGTAIYLRAIQGCRGVTPILLAAGLASPHRQPPGCTGRSGATGRRVSCRHEPRRGLPMRGTLRPPAHHPARQAAIGSWSRRHSSMPSARRAARRPCAVSSRTALWESTQ